MPITFCFLPYSLKWLILASLRQKVIGGIPASSMRGIIVERKVIPMDTKALKDCKEPQVGPIVEIQVNNIVVGVHRGRRTVVEIKQAAGIPLADVLNHMVDGKLTELPNDGAITIKGGEEFFSQPQTGGDS